MKKYYIIMLLLVLLPASLVFSQSIPDSLIFDAVTNNNLDMVKALVEQGANVNAVYKDEGTLLMWAAYKADLNMVKYLVEKGADYRKKGAIITEDVKGFFLGSLLCTAVFTENLMIVRYLVEECGLSVNELEYNPQSKREDGRTPIYYSIIINNFEITKYLIEKGAEINAKDINGFSPITYAFINSLVNGVNHSFQIIDYFANLGAEIDTTEITEYLVSHGMVMDTKEREILLKLGVQTNNSYIVKWIINKGVNTNIKDYEFGNILHKAVYNGNIDNINLLIDNGADINAIGKNGYTPLFASIFWLNTEVAKLLIDKGADVNIPDSSGYTPLYISKLRCYNDLTELLLSKGADSKTSIYSQTELVLDLGHTTGIKKVTFTSDDKYFLSEDALGNLKLWNNQTNKLIKAYEGTYFNTSLSLDERYIMSDGKLTDFYTGSLIKKIDGYNMVLMPDASILYAYNDFESKTRKLRNIKPSNEKIIKEIPNISEIYYSLMTVSKDRHFAAIFIDTIQTLRIIDLEKGIIQSELYLDSKNISSLSFSPDNSQILACFIEDIKLIKIASKKIVSLRPGYVQGNYRTAVFSYDGNYIIYEFEEKTEKSKINSLSYLCKMNLNTGFILADTSCNFISFIDNIKEGKELIVGDWNGNIKFLDFETLKERKVINKNKIYYNSFKLSGSNNYLLSSFNYVNNLNVLNLRNNGLTTYKGESHLFDLSLNEKYLINNSFNKLDIFDFRTYNYSRSIICDTNYSIYKFIVSNDSKYIALKLIGKNNPNIHSISIYDFEGNIVFKDINNIYGLWNSNWVFSYDSKYFAYFGNDSSIHIIDIGKKKEKCLIKCQIINGDNAGPAFVFSNKDEIIYTNHNIATRYNVNNCKEVSKFNSTIYPSSFSISKDDKYIAFDSYEIILFDYSRKKRASTFPEGIFTKSNSTISNNNEFLFYLSQKNKINICDINSGKIAASFFYVDSTDWVVMTPDYQFDASPNSMKLMHFTVQTEYGFEVIDLEQLKERYYEPGLMQKILHYNNEPIRDVKGFNDIKLFPEIKLKAPTKEDKYLYINLTDRGGGIGKIKVLINGKELTADARDGGDDFIPEERNIELKVDISKSPYLLPGSDNKIEVYAFNAEGYLSSRAVEIHYTPEGTLTAETPAFYGIIVGISNYEGEKLRLRYSSKDAEDFGKSLNIGARKLFGENKTFIKVLNTGENNSEQPIKQNIVNAFESLQNIKQNDVVVVYFAGHGVNLGSGTESEDFYYLTKEARTGNLEDPEIRKLTSISSKELTDLLLKIPALKQVLILDVCGSGKIVDKLTEKRDVPSSQIRAFERMKDRAGLNILSGCASDAVSYEASKYSQGLLTYSLLMGMKGGAVKEDGLVDVSRLFRFSEDEVPKLANNIGGIQQPRIFGSASFDIGLILGDDKSKIPLSTAKPLVLQTNFQDANLFYDHLGITQKVNLQLRDFFAERGNESKLVYVDANEFPDAYTVIGRYMMEKNEVKVNVKVFKSGKEVTSYSLSGETKNIDILIQKIISKLEELN